MQSISVQKLNDLPLSETIKYIESVIEEYHDELSLPDNADIRSKIWDAMQHCIELRKELCSLKDIDIIIDKPEANS